MANTLGGAQYGMMSTTIKTIPKMPKIPGTGGDYKKFARYTLEAVKIGANTYIEGEKEKTRRIEIENDYRKGIEAMLIENDTVIAQLAYKTKERVVYLDGLFALLKDAYNEGRVEDAKEISNEINEFIRE